MKRLLCTTCLLLAAPLAHAQHHHHHHAPAQPQAHQGHEGHTAPSDSSDAPHTPIPPLTEAARQAAFPAVAPHAMQHASSVNYLVLLDRLEGWDNARGHGQSWQAKAWLGGDIQRLWLRSEGERESNGAHAHLPTLPSSNHGSSTTWSLDALYGRALTPWWDVVAGLRHDSGSGASHTRAAIGLQGLAPYRFEVSATAYLGGKRTAELALEAEYQLLLTQRLILQPTWQAHWLLKDDHQRNVGSGLSQMHSGMRLRWEITRQFAPYIGFTHERSYGTTARWQREASGASHHSRWVAGVRVGF